MRTKPFLYGIVLLSILWSFSKVTGIRSEYSVDQFYPKEHILLKGHDAIQKQFRLTQESPYLFVLEMKKRDAWIERKNVDRLRELSSYLQLLQGVSSLLTLTHVEGATTENDQLIIGNIFDRIEERQWKERVLSNPLLFPLLVTEDFRSTLVAVEPSMTGEKERAVFEKDVLSYLKSYFPDAVVHTAGVPVVQGRLSGLIQSELSLFLVLLSAAFCAVFYLLFSHSSAIICAAVTLGISNLFSLSLMSAFGISMNVLLVTLPVIVSVSIMSLLIHSLHLWSQKSAGLSTLEQKETAAIATLKELFIPNALGILTTALGFLALAPSPIPLIGQYGWIVALILGFVAVLGHLVILLSLPYVKPKMRGWFDHPAKWSLWSLHHAKGVLMTTVILASVAATLIPQLNFSSKLFDDLPAGDEIRESTDWIDRSFGGILHYELSLTSQEPDFWKKSTRLSQLQNLTKEIRTWDNVGTVLSVVDLFQGKVPRSNSEISETFFLFSMAEKNPLLNLLSDDGRILRLSVRLQDQKAHILEETKKSILAEAKRTFPLVEITEGGMANYAHEINQEVAKSLIFDFWQPLLLIGVSLIFIFRSFRWAILSCLPNFIPPLMLIMCLSLSQVSIKPGIALIFSIALGFAFNNTLYLLSRIRSLEAQGETEPLTKALLLEANPCLFESFIMFVGFSLFLTSDFTMNQTFGGFMLISILAGFLADLVFLPAFLKVFPSSYKKGLPLGAILLFSFHAEAQDAKSILKRSQALLDAKDDAAMVEMKIIEANGEAKSRNLELKTLRKDGFSVLARIQSPADIKDMAFLGNVDPEGNEVQWIYLPSSGQVRRLVTGKTKAGLLGSEISPEDLNSEAIKSASTKLMKTDKDYFWIEIIPDKGTSEYSKVVTKISVVDHLPKFTAYYVQSKLKKTVAFKDYKKIGPVWRAHVLSVQNHMNKRSTEVRLANVKVNTGLSSDDFTQTSLKEN